MIGDPYKILGISPNATDDEVKKAYRELSRKYHPDSYSDNPLAELAEEKFKEVQRSTGSVPAKRERINIKAELHCNYFIFLVIYFVKHGMKLTRLYGSVIISVMNFLATRVNLKQIMNLFLARNISLINLN